MNDMWTSDDNVVSDDRPIVSSMCGVRWVPDRYYVRILRAGGVYEGFGPFSSVASAQWFLMCECCLSDLYSQRGWVHSSDGDLIWDFVPQETGLHYVARLSESITKAD